MKRTIYQYNKKILNNSQKNQNTTKFYNFESRFQKYYNSIIKKDFLYKQNLKNISQIPQLNKIVLSTTSKLIVNEKKYIIPGLLALEMIIGKKLKLTRASHSIAAFKLRKNQIIGCKVTLRGDIMFQFLEKLITIILPRLREFQGVDSNKIDTQGNYTIGLNNLLLIPELENHFEFFEFLRGINIILIPSTHKKKDACLLFSAFQLPIQK